MTTSWFAPTKALAHMLSSPVETQGTLVFLHCLTLNLEPCITVSGCDCLAKPLPHQRFTKHETRFAAVVRLFHDDVGCPDACGGFGIARGSLLNGFLVACWSVVTLGTTHEQLHDHRKCWWNIAPRFAGQPERPKATTPHRPYLARKAPGWNKESFCSFCSKLSIGSLLAGIVFHHLHYVPPDAEISIASATKAERVQM